VPGLHRRNCCAAASNPKGPRVKKVVQQSALVTGIVAGSAGYAAAGYAMVGVRYELDRTRRRCDRARGGPVAIARPSREGRCLPRRNEDEGASAPTRTAGARRWIEARPGGPLRTGASRRKTGTN